MPDILSSFDAVRPFVFLWLIFSIVLCFTLLLWPFSLACSVVGISSASYFLCGSIKANNIYSKSHNTHAISIAVFILDVAFLGIKLSYYFGLILILILIGIFLLMTPHYLSNSPLFYSMMFIVSEFVLLVHAIMSWIICKKLREIKNILNPVSSGIVTIA